MLEMSGMWLNMADSSCRGNGGLGKRWTGSLPRCVSTESRDKITSADVVVPTIALGEL